MALIKCPECGNDISDRSNSCPKCGLPKRYYNSSSPDQKEKLPNKWVRLKIFEHLPERFPELNHAFKSDPDYVKVLNEIFKMLEECRLLIFTYETGFLGMLPVRSKESPRVYVSLFNLPKDCYCFIRVFNETKKYISYPCRSIDDVKRNMPKAFEALNSLRSDDTVSDDFRLPVKFISSSTGTEYYERLGGQEKACTIIKQHNEKWVSKQLETQETYLDNILVKIDPKIRLDEEQRKAILNDEDNALIVAGAGAGKTTTMAAKVKYLVDKKKIRPERILVISYTNKAVDELKDRIVKRLGIPAIIATFHKFGFDIVKKVVSDIPDIQHKPSSLISDYMETLILRDSKILKRILHFFSYYFDVPEDAMKFENLEQYHQFKASQDLQTLKSHLNEYNRNIMDKRTKAMRTCQGEFLRSYQEVQIANFLYMHNLEYEYEPHYPKPISGRTKPYTPDFLITQGDMKVYLEHFGINENGSSNIYSSAQLSKYISHIQDKRKIHTENGTTLLETYSGYNDGRSLLEHLNEVLCSAGFLLEERNPEEVYQKIIDTSKDKYFYNFVDFVSLFISRFKTNGYDESEFEVLKSKTDNVRTLLFLEIIEDVYAAYQEELKQKNKIDFDDMINEAEKTLNMLKEQGRKLPFDYIIIDEYQDISLQRFNLAKRLSEVTDAKIVAVGDDWQSIFAFAGSDITLFTRFLQLMGSGEELKITHTYRNSQELIDIAGSFIQKNSSQIKKQLVSPKSLQSPVEIILYDDTQNKMQNRSQALVDAIEKLLAEFGPGKNILVIGRYNFDMYQFIKSGYFEQKSDFSFSCVKFPEARLTFLTAHSSKGLGYDNVILANAIDNKFGFPCQIEDDPIMKHVIHEDKSAPFAEERRLFYVAITRTKNKVISLVPETRPSQFILELVNEHGVKCDLLYGKEYNDSWKLGLRCPQCGFPLKFEPFKPSIGLPLYICTNEPEICDFMTNSRERLADIRKCNKCSDGYLIVKKHRIDNVFFYGCTNYDEGKGCTNNMGLSVV